MLSSTQNYLGDFFIALVCGKLWRSIGMMIKARQGLKRKALMTLYYSFFYPYLTYCDQVWGSTYATHIATLHLIQKKALRTMCGVNRRKPKDPLFPKLESMKLPNIHLLLTSRFMFQSNRGQVPNILSNFFTRKTDVYGYSTGQHHHAHVPCERSKLRQFSIPYHGAILCHSLLKLDINPDTPEDVFVKLIKNA